MTPVTAEINLWEIIYMYCDINNYQSVADPEGATSPLPFYVLKNIFKKNDRRNRTNTT